MNFKQIYLGEFVVDGKHHKAQLLWLWYDYQTEIYDRNLWSTRPSKCDETMVVLESPEARKFSMKNATIIKGLIYKVAEYYKIFDEDMLAAKNDSFRKASTMKRRLELFEEYSKNSEFEFMERALEKMDSGKFR